MADLDYTSGSDTFVPPRIGDDTYGSIHLCSNNAAQESFSAGPTQRDANMYMQGSRRLGHPGIRGMVTSSREQRPAIEAVAADNRPPHYAPNAPNEYAHLYIDPKAQGPVLYQKPLQTDRFVGGGADAGGGVQISPIIIILSIVIVIALWAFNVSLEHRLMNDMRLLLLEARMLIPGTA